MKIESISMENIRSHVKSEINFSEGFNCLIGGVGSGKSSILYAIDFALFGQPLGRAYDYLLREEASKGKIVLNFQKNSKKYMIVRVLKRQGGGITQDTEHLKLFESDNLLAEMKNDAVAEQLRSITGFDQDIFHEIVWVRQEHLKEILDTSPRIRQGRLDQLFGLSDYETSWINLRPILGIYQAERENLERDPEITGIKDLQNKYDEAVQDLSTIEVELEKVLREFSEMEVKMRDASSRLKEIEDVRQQNERLKTEEKTLESQQRNLEIAVAKISGEMENRKTRLIDLEDRLASLENRKALRCAEVEGAGLPRLFSDSALKSHIDTLIVQLSALRGEEESSRTEIKKASQRIDTLAKESKCPLCLQSLNSEYKSVMMANLHEEINHYKESLTELQRNSVELERDTSHLNSILLDLRAIQSALDDTHKQLGSERVSLKRVLFDSEQKQKELNVIKVRITDLQNQTMKFDDSQIEEAEKHYMKISEQLFSSRSRKEILESQRNEISLRLDDLKERLDIAEMKLARNQKVRKIENLVQEMRQAYRSIQPKIRSEFITYMERVVQQVLDELTGIEGTTLTLRIDENYTPIIEGEGKRERNVLNLSGGERTLLAFAYRVGLGQMIMQWRVGHGLNMLLLDEPTESLGREDGSIDRLAEAIGRLKTVEQVIAVTHSEAFAERAEHVIRLEKRNNQSRVYSER